MGHLINDCHNHLVNFLQETEGARALLEQMDRHQIDHCMVTGMMVVKKWDAKSPQKPRYYLDDDARCYWYAATDLIVARELLQLPEACAAAIAPRDRGIQSNGPEWH